MLEMWMSFDSFYAFSWYNKYLLLSLLNLKKHRMNLRRHLGPMLLLCVLGSFDRNVDGAKQNSKKSDWTAYDYVYRKKLLNRSENIEMRAISLEYIFHLVTLF